MIMNKKYNIKRIQFYTKPITNRAEYLKKISYK